jgi:hypothetical protein
MYKPVRDPLGALCDTDFGEVVAHVSRRLRGQLRQLMKHAEAQAGGQTWRPRGCVGTISDADSALFLRLSEVVEGGEFKM